MDLAQGAFHTVHTDSGYDSENECHFRYKLRVIKCVLQNVCSKACVRNVYCKLCLRIVCCKLHLAKYVGAQRSKVQIKLQTNKSSLETSRLCRISGREREVLSHILHTSGP